MQKIRNIGILFGGQGHQRIGMANELLTRWPKARDWFDEAGEITKEPLLRFVQEGPQERLNDSEIAQTVTITHSIATWNSCKSMLSQENCLLLGYSLGQYAALCAAECLSFRDIIALVHARGKILRKAVEKSGKEYCMLLATFCNEPNLANIDCQVACTNSKTQFLLAVERSKKIRVLETLPEVGRAVEIPVNIPFHTKYLSDTIGPFVDIVKEIKLKPAVMPVISNVTAKWFDVNNSANELLHHLIRPVQWKDSLEFAVSQGMNTILNVGPGRCNVSSERSTLKILTPEGLKIERIGIA